MCGGGGGACVAGEKATTAGGTHPTGMHSCCRLSMEYGGCDLTRCLYLLLSRIGFPYKECDLNNRYDAQFLMQIKEDLLHMDQVCVLTSNDTTSGLSILNVINACSVQPLFHF